MLIITQRRLTRAPSPRLLDTLWYPELLFKDLVKLFLAEALVAILQPVRAGGSVGAP